ncbi:FkbM family methyltransferase [Desulfosoma sp.]
MIDYAKALSQLFSIENFPQDAFFIDRIFGKRPIVVYGAGEAFHYFHEVIIKEYGYIPRVILDQKFGCGEIFNGIPACAPDQYTATEEEMKSGVAVVCMANQRYIEDVVQYLKHKGFTHILTLNDIYEIHNPFSQPPELVHKGFQFYLEQRDSIEKAFTLMEDQESRCVFFQCVKTHMTRKPVSISMRCREEQYTPQDLPLSKGYGRLIYCGASVGEMARVFTSTGKIEELVCFEPHPVQYREIARFLGNNKTRIARRVTILPCAVFSHEAIMPFKTSETSFGSRIVSKSDDFVQTVSIDTALPGFAPSYILMDIEGAELEALKGATKTIQESTPDLAICVYHSPSHLWDVPLFLHKSNPRYRFYLRNYTSLIYETVLYATT